MLPENERPAIVLDCDENDVLFRQEGLKNITVARPPGGVFEDVMRVELYGIFLFSSRLFDSVVLDGEQVRDEEIKFVSWNWVVSARLTNVSKDPARVYIDTATLPAGSVVHGTRPSLEAPPERFLATRHGKGARQHEPGTSGSWFKTVLKRLVKHGNRLPRYESPFLVVVQQPVDGLGRATELIVSRPDSGKFQDVFKSTAEGVLFTFPVLDDEGNDVGTTTTFIPWRAMASVWLEHGRAGGG